MEEEEEEAVLIRDSDTNEDPPNAHQENDLLVIRRVQYGISTSESEKLFKQWLLGLRLW